MSKFPERLMSEREASGLTRKKLAELLNVSPRAVAYWEQGLRECDFDTLIKLANILNTTIDNLLGRDY